MVKTHPSANRPHGFTNLEVLAVTTILMILLGLSISAFQSMGRAHELTSAGQTLSDLLQLARLQAITRNQPVLFRFYQLPESGTPLASEYNAAQASFENDDRAVFNMTRLGLRLKVLRSETASSLLQTGSGQTEGEDDRGKYLAFRFRADGSTDLAAVPGYTVTIVRKDDPVSSSGLPSNFATIQLDPVNGRVRTYRP